MVYFTLNSLSKGCCSCCDYALSLSFRVSLGSLSDHRLIIKMEVILKWAEDKWIEGKGEDD